jgi:hypothetical protein
MSQRALREVGLGLCNVSHTKKTTVTRETTRIPTKKSASRKFMAMDGIDID